MNDKLYIVIPAYNEEANIKQVIEEWYPVAEAHGEDSRLVIVNDGSKDKTYNIISSMAKDMPLLVALNKENGGHGAAVLFGYKYALDHGADYIFQTDSDGQTLPSEFEPFWSGRDKYDILIGYRNNRKDGFSRIIVTRVLRLVVRICFGVFVLDANTPYRLMKAKGLKSNMKYIPKDFFLSNVALSAIYKKKGMKMHFIPITFRPRQGGTNSINVKKIISVGIKAFSDFKVINNNIKSDTTVS